MAITANSSERLARELDRIGQPGLAANARANQYHDYLSDSATPATDLVHELGQISQRSASAAELRKRVMEGEFDAPDDESDEWAASAEGQETFGKLLRGE
jgi:hypothetical protein